MNKYHARRVTLDGYAFDSQAEARRYGELKLMERAGEIKHLQVHPRFELCPKEGGLRAITYVADFQYCQEPHGWIAEDVKGGTATQTPVWKLKWNLVQRRYPNIEFRIIEA